jgi:death-on-curing protein
VDGNKRLALAATIAFLGINGRRLTFTNDQVYELVMNVAADQLNEIAGIAGLIREGSEPW